MSFIRKIPALIDRKLRGINSPSVQVAVCLSVDANAIDSLGLSMLGVRIENQALVVPAIPVYPPESYGAVANQNINGRELVDKNSPKILKHIYLGDRPIYGDWSNGSFDLWQTREVYRKVLIPPNGFSLRLSNEGYDDTAKKWKLVVAVVPPLDRNAIDFMEALIFALSLIREVTRQCDIYAADTSPTDVASAKVVSWEIFPPGQRDLKSEVARRIIGKSDSEKKFILDRAGTIEKLKPKQFVLGSGLASNYYGALFANDLVVFENLDYGNATYILYDNWQELSQLSRSELLRGKENFDRIVHGKKWDKHLAEVVSHELNRRRSKWS